MVFTNGFFSWNAVDLSAHVREIHLTPRITTVPDHDVMGSTSEQFAKVLQGYDLSIVFRQSYVAAQVDVTVGVDHLAGTARAWKIRPDAAVVGATNPEWRGTGMITEYGAIEGAFGDVLGARMTIVPTTGSVTRNIT